MLSAKFAAQFQPVIKEIRASLNDFKGLQRDVLITLGLVVAVDFLQTLVEQCSKLIQILRSLREFDEPLMATFRILIHKDWGCCVFQNFCACLLAGIT